MSITSFSSILCRKLASRVMDITYNGRKVNARSVSNVTDYPVPSLTTAVIKDRLKKNNMPFVDGHTCFRLQECCMCDPLKKKSSTGKSAEMFVNKLTGYFVCELCKSAGPWNTIERLMLRHSKGGEKTLKELQILRDGCVSYYEKGQQSWKKVLDENRALHLLPDEEYAEVYRRFDFTECSKQIAEKLNIIISNNGRTLYLPVTSHTTQLVLGYLSVEVSKTSMVPKQNCAGFLIYAFKKKATAAVVVSNPRDFFALASLNLTATHVICLPYGVASLPQIALPFLENYESLVLWLGSVPCAWEATRNFARKLNEKRCFVIRSSEQLTPADAVANKADVHKMIQKALPTWHQAITTFSSLRADIYQELVNHEEVLGIRWRRFPTLNKILRGHRRGELTVLTGPTGSGKTTFMSEYSLDLAAQGVNTLWGSFEVRNVRLARTMLQQFVGCPLEIHLGSFDKWADDFERLPLFFLTFHGQQSVRNVMEAVKHATYIHDIGHVIIDNVQFMIGMSEENAFDRFHKQDLIIHAFRSFATQANCHVTLVIHPRKEREGDDLTSTSIFGGAKAAQEADNVLIIQNKGLTTLKVKKYLQVSALSSQNTGKK